MIDDDQKGTNDKKKKGKQKKDIPIQTFYGRRSHLNSDFYTDTETDANTDVHFEDTTLNTTVEAFNKFMTIHEDICLELIDVNKESVSEENNVKESKTKNRDKLDRNSLESKDGKESDGKDSGE